MSRTEVKDDDSQRLALEDKVTSKAGLGMKRIHTIDVLCSAISEEKTPKNENLFVTAIFGTGEERPVKDISSNIKTYSGPIGKSTTAVTQGSKIQGMKNSELYVGHDEFNRQAEQPLTDFVSWLAKKAEADIKNNNTTIEPIRWLLMGHSRGGAIARILTHPTTIERTVKLESGDSIVIQVEVNKEDPTQRTITIYDANKRKKLKQYSLDMYLLLFSATPGLGSEDFKEFNEVRAKVLIDFLAAQDVGVKAHGYEPLHHRRTINEGGSNLFVHMPVRHHVVVKAEPKRIIHLEIELLFSYLLFRHIGVPVDPNGLWTLVRDNLLVSLILDYRRLILGRNAEFFRLRIAKIMIVLQPCYTN